MKRKLKKISIDVIIAMHLATLLITAGGILITTLNPTLQTKKGKENKRMEKENRKERVKEKEKAKAKLKEAEAMAISQQPTPPIQLTTQKSNRIGKISTAAQKSQK